VRYVPRWCKQIEDKRKLKTVERGKGRRTENEGGEDG
jgi:hypothetical protein